MKTDTTKTTNQIIKKFEMQQLKDAMFTAGVKTTIEALLLQMATWADGDADELARFKKMVVDAMNGKAYKHNGLVAAKLRKRQELLLSERQELNAKRKGLKGGKRAAITRQMNAITQQLEELGETLADCPPVPMDPFKMQVKFVQVVWKAAINHAQTIIDEHNILFNMHPENFVDRAVDQAMNLKEAEYSRHVLRFLALNIARADNPQHIVKILEVQREKLIDRSVRHYSNSATAQAQMNMGEQRGRKYMIEDLDAWIGMAKEDLKRVDAWVEIQMLTGKDCSTALPQPVTNQPNPEIVAMLPLDPVENHITALFGTKED